MRDCTLSHGEPSVPRHVKTSVDCECHIAWSTRGGLRPANKHSILSIVSSSHPVLQLVERVKLGTQLLEPRDGCVCVRGWVEEGVVGRG